MAVAYRDLGACAEKLSWAFFTNKGSTSDPALALVPDRAGTPVLPN